MITKTEMLKRLNEGIDPESLGFSLRADDGENQYWVRGQVRLNRNIETNTWDEDVEGWEKL